jgi:hypothetical protein
MGENHICPNCKQMMLMRHGVMLTPKLGWIFDYIERSERGVPPQVLRRFFANRPARAAHASVEYSIWEINDRLASTDRRIGMRHGSYRVKRRRS